MSPKSAKTLCSVFLPAFLKKILQILNVMYYFILLGFWAYRGKPYKIACTQQDSPPQSGRL